MLLIEVGALRRRYQRKVNCFAKPHIHISDSPPHQNTTPFFSIWFLFYTLLMVHSTKQIHFTFKNLDKNRYPFSYSYSSLPISLLFSSHVNHLTCFSHFVGENLLTTLLVSPFLQFFVVVRDAHVPHSGPLCV